MFPWALRSALGPRFRRRCRRDRGIERGATAPRTTMSSAAPNRVRVTPVHEIELQEALAPLIAHPPEHDFVMRRLSEKLANGEPLIQGELVIAGKDTLDRYPLAREYPVHFRKTYYPTCFHQDPVQELHRHQRAAEILPIPPPIGCTRTSFRSCFLPGHPLDKLAPFGLEPPDANLRVAEEMPIAARIGLWRLFEVLHGQITALHRAGLVHGDLFLHNVIVSTAPIGVYPIDFELAVERAETATDEAWRELCEQDLLELRRAAAYLLCVLGPQPGELAAEIGTRLEDLFPRAPRVRERLR